MRFLRLGSAMYMQLNTFHPKEGILPSCFSCSVSLPVFKCIAGIHSRTRPEQSCCGHSWLCSPRALDKRSGKLPSGNRVTW